VVTSGLVFAPPVDTMRTVQFPADFSAVIVVAVTEQLSEERVGLRPDFKVTSIAAGAADDTFGVTPLATTMPPRLIVATSVARSDFTGENTVGKILM
jgi:hypothetical protein